MGGGIVTKFTAAAMRAWIWALRAPGRPGRVAVGIAGHRHHLGPWHHGAGRDWVPWALVGDQADVGARLAAGCVPGPGSPAGRHFPLGPAFGLQRTTPAKPVAGRQHLPDRPPALRSPAGSAGSGPKGGAVRRTSGQAHGRQLGGGVELHRCSCPAGLCVHQREVFRDQAVGLIAARQLGFAAVAMGKLPWFKGQGRCRSGDPPVRWPSRNGQQAVAATQLGQQGRGASGPGAPAAKTSSKRSSSAVSVRPSRLMARPSRERGRSV